MESNTNGGVALSDQLRADLRLAWSLTQEAGHTTAADRIFAFIGSAARAAPGVPADPPTYPIIELGFGKVEVAEGMQGDRFALIFGRNGTGIMNGPTRPSREMEPGESLAVVTFANIESWYVVLAKLLQIRRKMLAAAPSAHAGISQQAGGAVQFADHIINGVFEGGDFDGGTLQALAVEHGLLVEQQMPAPCGEDGSCQCALNGSEFPTTCFRKTYLGDPALAVPVQAASSSDTDVIARQLAIWRKERARLDDLIATADPEAVPVQADRGIEKASRVGKSVAIGSDRIIVATAIHAEWADEIVAALNVAAAAPAAPLPLPEGPSEKPEADSLIKWIDLGCPGVELMSNRRIMSNYIRALAATPVAPPVAPSPDIASMVDRFLGWKLPFNFQPDGGISFVQPTNLEWWPVGTHLLSADQAKAMFEYVTALPGSTPDAAQGGA